MQAPAKACTTSLFCTLVGRMKVPQGTGITTQRAVDNRAISQKLASLPHSPLSTRNLTWWFTKIRGTILGVPIVRTLVFWGLYWGPLFRETTTSSRLKATASLAWVSQRGCTWWIEVCKPVPMLRSMELCAKLHLPASPRFFGMSCRKKTLNSTRIHSVQNSTPKSMKWPARFSKDTAVKPLPYQASCCRMTAKEEKWHAPVGVKKLQASPHLNNKCS